MHTILGANGPVAQSLSQALQQRGLPLRQVSRNPRRVHPSDALFSADLRDAQALEQALQGTQVAYLVAGLPYDTATWQRDWPRIMDQVIQAAQRQGCKLVFFDNVYAYGRSQGPMTETSAFNPCSRKGQVRAQIAQTFVQAMQSGLPGMLVRAADFYGPGKVNSLFNALVLTRLLQGKKPQWLCDPERLHSYTFVPDIGPAMAHLVHEDSAWGHTWHLPTSRAQSSRDLIQQACSLAGQNQGVAVLPAWLRKSLALFMASLRENEEMMYQFEHDYVFDSSAVHTRFGLQATPYAQGLRAALQKT